jgi:ABC transporter substrate binding protein
MPSQRAAAALFACDVRSQLNHHAKSAAPRKKPSARPVHALSRMRCARSRGVMLVPPPLAPHRRPHLQRGPRGARLHDGPYGRERTPTRMVPSGATSTTTSVKCSAVSTFSMARCSSPRCSGVRFIEAREPNELDAAFVTIRSARLEALLVVADTMFIVHRARLADLAVKNRLPSMHGVRENVEAGGLMSYGPNSVANYRRAAAFVDKILKGAKPADLPVEQPTTVELVLNLKTAKALGLTIPPSLLGRADQVIE